MIKNYYNWRHATCAQFEQQLKADEYHIVLPCSCNRLCHQSSLPPAVGCPTETLDHLPLHRPHIVVVVPGQLLQGLDVPGGVRREGEKTQSSPSPVELQMAIS